MACHLNDAAGRILMVSVIAALVLVIAACGESEATSTTEPFRKAAPADRSYSLEDFQAIGFKTVKEYNVEGLPHATAAWFGFWRLEGQQPANYELRVYSSHATAVQHGTALAEEVTGEDAVLYEVDLTWKEGARDRRAHDMGFAGQAYYMYGDFAIFGNVVMLCEGPSGTSIERCEAIVNALRTLGAE